MSLQKNDSEALTKLALKYKSLLKKAVRLINDFSLGHQFFAVLTPKERLLVVKLYEKKNTNTLQ